MRRLICACALAGLFASSGCGEPEDPLPHLDTGDGCQPLLSGYDCLLPYPSDYFQVEDASLPSGHRIEVRGKAKLTTKTGVSADVNAIRPIDGFSRVPYIVFAFPNDVVPDGFVRLFDDPDASTDPKASNTLLIEEATGARVPHFVDLDARATDPLHRALVIHPYVRLNASSRYVVLVHNVRQADGTFVPPPEGFRRLRDSEGKSDPALQPLREAFELRILPAADRIGIPRSELQLGWELTTGSDEHVERDMRRIRELTLAWLKTNTPEVTITSVEENPETDVWRRIAGTVSMPLFVESTDPGAQLHRGDDGQVAQNGTAVFPFEAQIPVVVRDQFEPGRILTYGHGFFGGTNEIHGQSARDISTRLHAVLFATPWWGMSLGDSTQLADALNNRPFKTFDPLERTHQAMANWIVFTRAIEKVMPTLPAFQRPTTMGEPGVVDDGNGHTNAGQPVFAGEADAYVGISQGGILGGTMAALNPDVTRPVLNVGGAGFTHMMFRARPFNNYLFFLDLSMPDPFVQQKFVATLQRPFDRFDPATWDAYLIQDLLPDTPPRRVLFQYGIGDAEVPNVGTHLAARIAGLKLLDDGGPAVYGIDKVAPPVEGSALVAFDFGIDVKALNEQPIPPDPDNEVHEGVRRLNAALTQMETFISEGRIVNACEGRCDPE
ncbi:MAG: hypothetical protein IRZ16_13565 [Myxococcaceae bacterium]|nr:hypothetical protein [Myxococcaceae bacterium]